MTLLERTLANPYTTRSIETIKRHSPLNRTAALRLLRRNVRDVSPRAPAAIQHSIARQILDTQIGA